jgi:hypothetical protein
MNNTNFKATKVNLVVLGLVGFGFAGNLQG